MTIEHRGEMRPGSGEWYREIKDPEASGAVAVAENIMRTTHGRLSNFELEELVDYHDRLERVANQADAWEASADTEELRAGFEVFKARAQRHLQSIATRIEILKKEAQ